MLMVVPQEAIRGGVGNKENIRLHCWPGTRATRTVAIKQQGPLLPLWPVDQVQGVFVVV